MSRIGRQPIPVAPGVEVSVGDGVVTVKGPKGTLARPVHERMTVTVNGAEVRVERASETKRDKALHGTTRALIANMVQGVTKGFERKLEIHGVGYRARLQGRTLDLSVGKVRPCLYELPEGINVDIGKNTLLTVTGIDKELVGQVAADIRRFRPPEPYQGKGIRYADEHVRRKTGKTVG